VPSPNPSAQFQEGAQDALWGGEEVQGSVVACDLYNAAAFIGVPDEDIVNVFAKELLPAVVDGFKGAHVVDSWVGKYPGGVSHFSPGSLEKRPLMQGDAKAPGIKFGERDESFGALVRPR
jgi:hypothetical protein